MTKSEYRMKFAERLKTLRNKNNMTAMDLSYKIGVAEQTLSRWENAKTEPKLTQLSKIAEEFDVSIDYLTGRTDIEQTADNTLSIDDIKNAVEEKLLESQELFTNTTKSTRATTEKTPRKKYDIVNGIFGDMTLGELLGF